jgi:protein CpxP
LVQHRPHLNLDLEIFAMCRNLRQILIASTALAVLGGFVAGGAHAASNDPSAAAPPATASGKTERPIVAKQAAPTMAQRVEQRIADMHARLHITPDQQPQWDQFALVMRDNAMRMDQIVQQQTATLTKMSALEQMQAYSQIADEHAKDVHNLIPAFQSLYGSMSDEQKKTADHMFREEAEHGRHEKHS